MKLWLTMLAAALGTFLGSWAASSIEGLQSERLARNKAAPPEPAPTDPLEAYFLKYPDEQWPPYLNFPYTEPEQRAFMDRLWRANPFDMSLPPYWESPRHRMR